MALPNIKSLVAFVLIVGVVLLAVVGFWATRVQSITPTPTPPPTPPFSILVNSTTDAVDGLPGDSTCDTVAGPPVVCTLRAAIMEANGLGVLIEIIVPAGTYTLTIAGNGEDGAATGDLDITTDLWIYGAGADITTVEQSTNDRVFHILAGNDVFMDGFTIADGAPPAGAGGGGIRNRGSLTLVASTIKNNSATSGGGFYQYLATAMIYESTISKNAVSTQGGGIYNSSSTLTIINSTLSGNAADGSGGALDQVGVISNVDLINVTITGNTADADNNSTGSGGGVALNLGTSSVANSIIAGNSTLNNDADNCSGTWTSAGYNLIGHDSTCTFVATTGDQVGTFPGALIDPLLGPLTDNDGPTLTHAIHGASPAVDAGNPATPGSGGGACEPVDQRKVVRAKDGDLDTNAVCDIGAFEAPTALACTAALCLDLDIDADFLVTVADLGLSSDPCEASGVLHVALDAVADIEGGANGKDEQPLTIDFVSGWITCPGPMYGGSSIPSAGFIEEQTNTTAGLDFPADVTLVLCLEIDTIIPALGLLQNCGAPYTKSPIVVECLALSYDLFDCEFITTGGTPKFLNTSGVEKASVDGSDTLTMSGVGIVKLSFPGDTDGDGCADTSENRPESELANGGGRNWLSPWDYYDVNGDGFINLFDDILGVISHFSLDGLGQYDVIYDRGPTVGPNPWNMTAPDGQINLFTDILGVIKQFTLNGCT